MEVIHLPCNAVLTRQATRPKRCEILQGFTAEIGRYSQRSPVIEIASNSNRCHMKEYMTEYNAKYGGWVVYALECGDTYYRVTDGHEDEQGAINQYLDYLKYQYATMH